MDTLYLYGSEVELNDSLECANFIKTQSISETVAKNAHYNLKLVFDQGYLSKIGENSDEDTLAFQMRDAEASEKKCPFIEAPAHQPYHIVASNEFASHLGGKVPTEFSMDDLDAPVPFQYLGKLDKSEYKNFDLSFDLHLCAPIYANTPTLFLDYSSPYRPRLYTPEVKDTLVAPYGELDASTEIVYEKQGIALRKADNIHNSGFKEYDDGEFEYVELFELDPPKLGHTGVPAWFQYPEIPTVPDDGRAMQFVCELDPSYHVKTAFHNIKAQDANMEEYFDHLHFWQGGTLKVFIDPDTALVCYYLSST